MFGRRKVAQQENGSFGRRPSGRMGRFVRRIRGERSSRRAHDAQQSVPTIQVTMGGEDESWYDDDDQYSASETVIEGWLDWLGIPEDRPEFRWIAEEASNAELPNEWDELEDENGDTMWENVNTGQVVYTHPNYTRYRALYERAIAMSEAESAEADERCLVVSDLPVDGADWAIEDSLSDAIGLKIWEEDVVQFDVFIDNDNTKCALLRLIDADARDELCDRGSLRLEAFGGRSVGIEAVDGDKQVLRMEQLARESRCVTVTSLPLGIDDTGVSSIFSLCDGELWSLRIEDISYEQGASALIEFTEAIAARRCARTEPRRLCAAVHMDAC